MNAIEVARLSGVSVRTLHHYDKIGLLTPGRNKGNGYRAYTQEDLDTLQQILFFRACGFSLSKIKGLLQHTAFDRLEALALQRKALLHEQQRLAAMLQTLDNTLRAAKGETTMTHQEKFQGFDFRENPYEQEARERWGDEAVTKSGAHIQKLGQQGQKALEASMTALFEQLATLRQYDPAAEPVQAAMAEMFRFFNESFGITYTPEAFAGLGQLYVDDERFTQNIDKYGEGLAAFLQQAMAIFAARHAG